MAKRATKSGTAARRRKGTQKSAVAGNGEDRPALAVRTNDKGQTFSHIRQERLAETPEERGRQAFVITPHNEQGGNLVLDSRSLSEEQ